MTFNRSSGTGPSKAQRIRSDGQDFARFALAPSLNLLRMRWLPRFFLAIRVARLRERTMLISRAVSSESVCV